MSPLARLGEAGPLGRPRAPQEGRLWIGSNSVFKQEAYNAGPLCSAGFLCRPTLVDVEDESVDRDSTDKLGEPSCDFRVIDPGVFARGTLRAGIGLAWRPRRSRSRTRTACSTRNDKYGPMPPAEASTMQGFELANRLTG